MNKYELIIDMNEKLNQNIKEIDVKMEQKWDEKK